MKFRIKKIAVIGLIFLVLGGIVSTNWAPLQRGIALRGDILAALASATEVRVVEHSSPYDNPQSRKEEYREVIFQEKTLTSDEIGMLRKALSISVDHSETMGRACFFQDHHRIEMAQPDGSRFVLDICFHCGDLRINQGHKRMMPFLWVGTLRRFFRDIGMKPDRSFRVPPPSDT